MEASKEGWVKDSSARCGYRYVWEKSDCRCLRDGGLSREDQFLSTDSCLISSKSLLKSHNLEMVDGIRCKIRHTKSAVDVEEGEEGEEEKGEEEEGEEEEGERRAAPMRDSTISLRVFSFTTSTCPS